MKTQFFDVNATQVNEVRKLCKHGSYRLLGKSEFPSCIPEGLTQKCVGAVLMASTCESGDAYVVNLLRDDVKAKEIDEMPLALIAERNTNASICLIHHGRYQGRSKLYGNEQFRDIVEARDKYLRFADYPPNKEGPLADLKGSSHEKALTMAIAKIKQHNQELEEKLK
jgi:hypothetical protein